jgi:hypothetical protein
MADSSKLTDKAVDLAADLAAQAAAVAADIAAQARKGAAESVGVIAEGLDNVTGGVLAEQISAVSNRVEDQLDKPAS